MIPVKMEGWSVLKGKGDILDLSVRRGADTALYSLWKLSFAERLSVLFGGHIAVGVLAEKHPPITVVVGEKSIPVNNHRVTWGWTTPCWCGEFHYREVKP